MTTSISPERNDPRSLLPRPASYGDRQRNGLAAEDLFDAITEHLFYTLGRRADGASHHDLYLALSYAVRDRMTTRHLAYKDVLRERTPKAVAYLSAEFLIGPQLGNNLLMLGIREPAAEALRRFGVADIDTILEQEEEPGLGNGGLGRLAACYLESLATLEIPATGYGIRYEFGIFDQLILNGWQVEITDKWLKGGWPWEMVQPEKILTVGFGGCTQHHQDASGAVQVSWTPNQKVIGIPHDVMVLGYRVNTCNRLRLWRSEAAEAFDFDAFDQGDHARAVGEKVRSESLSKVLYPSDGTQAGKELRLKQQFFFVSCSLQDMLRSLEQRGIPVQAFADHWAVQLNDTHPAIAVAELMRLLLDEHRLGWDQAWEITCRSIAYTNHTLLPEALECWSVDLFAWLLPRHLELIYEINHRFLQSVRLRFPGDLEILQRLSIIEEHGERRVRMAHLATVAAHHVNGVAALHSDLVATRLLADFARLRPQSFVNITNGVTPRRWLALANPSLTALLDEKLGDGWPGRPDSLAALEPMASDPAFLERWQICRRQAKTRLAALIEERSGICVDTDSLFDVQVKRIHAYKRQHLNALQLIVQYLRIRKGDTQGMVPRTVIFGGKAAPGYWLAKLIIRFINGIAEVVNTDPECRGLLQVLFLADFNVKLAEKIYPSADLCEQISTAGYEASGTGNMKFTLNGSLTIGTLDGANVEIRDHVGAENFFLFGHTVAQLAVMHDPELNRRIIETDPLLQEALHLISQGHFSDGDRELFQPLLASICHPDPFFVLADLADYLRAQREVDIAWADRPGWDRMAVLNLARSGFFSSDRAIADYAERIWTVKAEPIAMAHGHQGHGEGTTAR
jgi:starch phosphorylase